MKQTIKQIVTLILITLSIPIYAEQRVKDVTTIQGIRNNQLVGYGLVVGLEGTGDKSSTFTEQSFRSMLRQFGINVPNNQRIDIKNSAAVALSATLPPFSKPGQTIDVTVSSIGSAKSLRGGALLMSPLKGADGKVYAVAQGNLIVSGLGAQGADGSKVSVNISSVGRIPNGATVERVVAMPFPQTDHIVLNLTRPDFTNAKRIADAINRMLGEETASPMDPSAIKVKSPKDLPEKVDFISVVENIPVEMDDAPAKVVVNSRTGTIVIGEHVRVKPAAISHGSLTVTITENPLVSQPNPLSETGETVVTTNSQIQITKEDQKMFYIEGYTSLRDLVSAVNAVGAAPGDLMAILEALKEIGALDADVVVI